MKMHRLKRRLSFVIGGLVIISVCVSIFYNLHITKTQREAEVTMHETTLQVYMQFIEDTMTNIENMLAIETQADGDLKTILKAPGQLEQYLAFVRKKNDFEKEIKKYQFLDGIFLYDNRNQKYVGERGPYVTSADHTRIKKHMDEIISFFTDGGNNNEWMPVKLEGEYYLFRMLSVKALSFGTWIKPGHLLSDLQKVEKEGEKYFYLCDKKGNILNDAERNKEMRSQNFESYTFSSEKRPYTLLMQKKMKNFSEVNGNMIVQAVILICFGGILFFIVWLLTGTLVLEPLDGMFLKKELEKKQAELQFLQLQMNPHFLNNCLSLIRSLVLFRQNEEAEKAILLLGRYSRGSLQTDAFVRVEEELAHINAYYDLQKMRLDKEVHLEILTEDLTEKEKIPTMLIYTFVENAVKHQQYEADSIFVMVEMKYQGGLEKHKRNLWIQITDNGGGFEKEVLNRLAECRPIIDEEGFAHVGIYNVVYRLHILYGQEARVHFANVSEGGAQVTISIPLERRENDEK